ncbi:MAG UNVERIFIED_CONTAM: calcium-binding protein [Microcystis novacekii LVE1205-3]
MTPSTAAPCRHYQGGLGNDNIIGLGGFDLISRRYFGNDTCTGNNGNDTIIGGFGNDSLAGSTGRQHLPVPAHLRPAGCDYRLRHRYQHHRVRYNRCQRLLRLG